MLTRLLRITAITLFCSLAGCLLLIFLGQHFGIIALVDWPLFGYGDIFDDFNFEMPSPLLLSIVTAGALVGGFLLLKYRWRIYSGLLELLPSGIEPGRRTRRDGLAVLAYLEQAIRMNAPLSPILEAAAKTERGRLAWRLRNLRDMLDAGADLPDALYAEVPEVSDRAIGLIKTGERTGQLASVLARLLAEAEPELADTDYDSRFTLAYVVMMVIVMTIVIAMLGTFVEPKFLDLLRDLHMEPPALNQWLFIISTEVAPVLGIGLLVLIMLWLGYGIWAIIRRPRGAPKSIWEVFGYITAALPWIGDSQRDRSWADVCRVLADSFAAGLPADQALQQAEELALLPRVRSALRRWNLHVQTGAPLSEAAARAGLPEIFPGILAGAGAQTPAALDFLARYYTNRFSRLRILLRGAMIPMGVIFFASCVMVIDLSVFLPLIEIINHMADAVAGKQ